MRIRTANGVGFVRLWSALVIVLVLVMSGSAAFGQQSGRVVKPKKAATGQSAAGQVNDKIINKTSSKKADGVKPRPMPKEQEATIQTDPVYVEADGPEDGPRTSPPPFTEPASPYNSAGGGADAGGSSSGSTPSTLPDTEEGGETCVWETRRFANYSSHECAEPVIETILHDAHVRGTYIAGTHPRVFIVRKECNYSETMSTFNYPCCGDTSVEITRYPGHCITICNKL